MRHNRDILETLSSLLTPEEREAAETTRRRTTTLSIILMSSILKEIDNPIMMEIGPEDLVKGFMFSLANIVVVQEHDRARLHHLLDISMDLAENMNRNSPMPPGKLLLTMIEFKQRLGEAKHDEQG